MKKHIFAAICGAVAIGTVVVNAQQSGTAAVEPPGQSLKFAEPWRPNGASGATRVIGTVIDIRLTPVANAKVRVRNLATGSIEQVGESNSNGEYAFEMDRSGTYVVEMVLDDGFIFALSNAGTVAPFETLQTVIQLPGRWDAGRNNLTPQQRVVGFLGMSAATSMTSATLSLAYQEDVLAVDAGEPVSP
jgi:hypothetical protein